MEKLSLKLEDLHVESFATNGDRRPSGTVLANEDTLLNNTCVDGCTGAGTCWATCMNGCTGAGSCWAGDSCWGCDGTDDQTACGTDMGTHGVHCGPQGTMNPVWATCAVNTQAGPTCEGDTCLNCTTGC
jgi:hypothetical protein